MVDIAPLKPLRYSPDTLARVVAPPYDVIDPALRAELGGRDPHNVVHIDLPEGEGGARYENARRRFVEWQEQRVLTRDDTPAYYRYAQTFEPPEGGARIIRKGFFALVRALPYASGTVLPHERTLTGPKEDRVALSRATRAMLSPQFMLYADPNRGMDADLDSGAPYAAFRTDDGVEHELFRISEPGAIARITAALSGSSLLIADGHHRYETAVRMAEELTCEVRRAGRGPRADGEHLYTFALLANGDDPSLVVFATHRLVHSLPGFDPGMLASRTAEWFECRVVEGGLDGLRAALGASTSPAIGALTRGDAAMLLTLRSDVDLSLHPILGKRPEVLRRTAVALLHDAILDHVLGITPEAQAAKKNLRYVQDPRKGAVELSAGTAQVLFLMNPTPVATVRQVAESGEVMPQKSTFFYPKVPSGLFFHTLDPERSVR